VAAVVCGVLVGYPLWYQMNGPQSYDGIPHAARLGNDVQSVTTFASMSIGGGRPVGDLAYNPTEENGFLGWPLLLLAAVAAVWLWRTSLMARAAAVTGGFYLVASLGNEITMMGHKTGVPGPWRVLSHLPLVGWVLPSRLTFIAVPAIAVLLALATARVLAAASDATWTGAGDRIPVRLLWVGAVVAVLLPLAPTPFEAVDRPSVPTFFTSGAWKDHVGGDDRSILAAPPPDGSHIAPLRWQVESDFGFRMVEGYFIGPTGADRHGWYGAERRPTAHLLNTVWQSGVAVTADPERRQVAIEDLRFWRVDAVVLANGTRNEVALAATLRSLFGEGKRVADVMVWDVRPLTR
jgi:hypothetical protein